MKISIITLFPQVFDPILQSSILKRAQDKGLVEFELINLRDFGQGRHQIVDGRPYGGGAGMVLRADILAKATKKALKSNKSARIILTSASGERFDQAGARRLSKLKNIIVLCGHYEGVDQRFIEKYVDEEICIGDFVLTGGEIPAMAIVDSITRLIPGVLKKEEATINESFEQGLLEHPQYTRPDTFERLRVPEVLKSGNHQEVERWRRAESEKLTQKRRPDLKVNSH